MKKIVVGYESKKGGCGNPMCADCQRPIYKNVGSTDFELVRDLIYENDKGYLDYVIELAENGFYSRKNTLLEDPKQTLIDHIKPFGLGKIEDKILRGEYDANL